MSPDCDETRRTVLVFIFIYSVCSLLPNTVLYTTYRSGQLRTGTGFHVRLAAAGAAERGGRRRSLHRPASIALRHRSEPAPRSSDAIKMSILKNKSDMSFASLHARQC